MLEGIESGYSRLDELLRSATGERRDAATAEASATRCSWPGDEPGKVIE